MDEVARLGVEDAGCGICGDGRLCIRWTDHHGVGACSRCGAPYRVYHYEGDKRVDKPPQLLFLPEWVPLMKRYWEENHRNCDPGAYNMPGSSYEVATEEDFGVHANWMEAHKDEHPKPAGEVVAP